ncbi:DUF2726 domain-containing protein [Epidermidibacterium keratini]|uniref:DUF2726 domain-containing protein n=1 Tax=Epidermidibacterium keratini TaxID=1891644 RepID=A0A7L4YQY2_9ACTN|nr:DUF2726 domain-containing protein [Epidermidibacterium keratini]QHC01343.1 DUF2726 domain-containing protein [Epidermidibacterium keratini]
MDNSGVFEALPGTIDVMRRDAHVLSTLPEGCAVASRAELLGTGVSKRVFSDGRLVRIARGLYCLPDIAADSRALVRAFAERCPEDAVIGGWSAAAVHGIRDAGPTMLSIDPQPVVAYFPRHEHKRPPGFAVMRIDLDPADIEIIDGVSVTGLTRTAYDMVRFTRPLPQAVAILDCFRWSGNPHTVDLDELANLCAAHPRHKGNPMVRLALPLSSSRSRSIAESRVRVRWITEVGVSPHLMLTNANLIADGACYELDLVDLSAGLVIEYDGPHHAGSEQRSIDAAKNAAVADAGLAMLRLNAPELRLGRAGFARLADERRTRAKAAGAHIRAATLVARNELAELPLTYY